MVAFDHVETDEQRATRIFNRMGFPPEATGPHIDILRANMLEQVKRGLVGRSGGSWAPEAAGMSLDERARCILEIDWEIEHEHTYRREVIDGLFFGGKNRWRRTIRYLLPWIGDRFRKLGCKWRIFRDKHIYKLKNPYRKET